MQKCSGCGAGSPDDAAWCGQCYQPFAPVPATVGASSPVAPPAQFTQPAPTAPPPQFAPPRQVAQPSQPEQPAPFAAPSVDYVPPAPPAQSTPHYPPPADPFVPPPGAHPGWKPPAGTIPPALSQRAAAAADGRLLSGKALLLTALAIGVGAVGMGLSWLISRNTSLEPEVLIRYAIVITVSVYAVVATLLLTQLTSTVRLRWSHGSPIASAAIGLGCGVAFSLLLLGIVSAASGHLSPDPRIVLMMSEGDLAHIMAIVLISCLAAPLIEETLFRGVLLESLRPKGTGIALTISGLAFSVWHLTPSALRYYAVMGAALGYLYNRRGLVCSMAAHFGFNGVLTVAAIVVVLSPGPTIVDGNLTLHAPRGWQQVQSKNASPLVQLRGPSGSSVEILGLDSPVAPSLDAIEGRLADGSLSAYDPSITVEDNSIRTIDVGDVQAAAVDLEVKGHAGTLVFAPDAGTTYEIVFASGGSVKAKSDFDKMLAKAHIG